MCPVLRSVGQQTARKQHPRKQTSPAEGRRKTAARGTGQTGPEDQTGTFWGLQLGEGQVSTPGVLLKCGCKAASQRGLPGDGAAVEVAGRGVGARGKLTVAPPARRVHAGPPDGPVLGAQAGPAGSLQPSLGKGDDSQGLAPSKKIL